MTPAVFNIIIRGSLDADARAYCATTGATDKQNISRFFKGLKGQGLWDTSIFWMLRNNQNYGTGATVASAGGYGAANMTLTNGPQWGANGVVCLKASTQYGNATGLPDTRTGSMLGVFLTPDTGSEYIAMACNSATRVNGVLCRVTAGATHAASTAPGGGSVNLWSGSAFHQYATVRGNTSFAAGYDGGTLTASVAPTAILNSITSFWMSVREDLASPANATHALHMVTSTQITAAQNAAFYDLYKSTIGQGLSLP